MMAVTGIGPALCTGRLASGSSAQTSSLGLLAVGSRMRSLLLHALDALGGGVTFVGVLLISGLVLGFAAAWMPSLGPVWNERPPAQLLLIADRKRAWIASSVLFAAGLVTALFGVLVLSGLLIEAGARPPGWIGIGAFVVGTGLWLIHLGYRMTVMVSVAGDMAEGAAMPNWLMPTWSWGNLLLVTYVLLASVGAVALGVGILQTGLLPAWSAWTTIGLAILFMVTLAAFRNTMPVLPHLATGLLGIAAVLN